jgi:hypothetical protein
MLARNISNNPQIKEHNSGQNQTPPKRILSCGLLEALVDQYGDDHPRRVGRVDLIPFPKKKEV